MQARTRPRKQTCKLACKHAHARARTHARTHTHTHTVTSLIESNMVRINSNIRHADERSTHSSAYIQPVNTPMRQMVKHMTTSHQLCNAHIENHSQPRTAHLRVPTCQNPLRFHLPATRVHLEKTRPYTNGVSPSQHNLRQHGIRVCSAQELFCCLALCQQHRRWVCCIRLVFSFSLCPINWLSRTYVYIHICIYTYMYIYIYIQRGKNGVLHKQGVSYLTSWTQQIQYLKPRV